MGIISGGGGGGAPSGAAGGALAGTYPNPSLAASVSASGLTGSVAASRYVGATASGAPASGAHLVGDFVIAQNGGVFVCTVAGTPGTWVGVGGSQPITNAQYQGNTVSVANNAGADMPLNT